jgi:hypothetical protein
MNRMALGYGDRTWMGRSACIAALVVFALSIPYAASIAAPKSADGQTKARGPRLPNYYAKVSTPEQQPELRAVIKEYGPQIQQKREELAALIAKRDAALNKVLTSEQRQELARLRAAAASKQTGDKAAAGSDKAKKPKSKKKNAA